MGSTISLFEPGIAAMRARVCRVIDKRPLAGKGVIWEASENEVNASSGKECRSSACVLAFPVFVPLLRVLADGGTTRPGKTR